MSSAILRSVPVITLTAVVAVIALTTIMSQQGTAPLIADELHAGVCDVLEGKVRGRVRGAWEA